jgi:hypothetical protein
LPADPLRRDLLADLARRLALLSTPDLRVFDRVLVVTERRRGNPGAHPHDALVAALQEVATDLDAEDRDTAQRREAARDEMFGEELEFAADQHLTRLDTTPAVIALCEQPRDRDEEIEVDLLFDASDVEEPLGVHAPGSGGEVG